MWQKAFTVWGCACSILLVGGVIIEARLATGSLIPVSAVKWEGGQ